MHPKASTSMLAICSRVAGGFGDWHTMAGSGNPGIRRDGFRLIRIPMLWWRSWKVLSPWYGPCFERNATIFRSPKERAPRPGPCNGTVEERGPVPPEDKSRGHPKTPKKPPWKIQKRDAPPKKSLRASHIRRYLRPTTRFVFVHPGRPATP